MQAVIGDEYEKIESTEKRMPSGKELEVIDNLRGVSGIIFDWAILASCLILSVQLHWLFLPLLMVIVGARQHGLLILMHEQVHYHLFTNKKWGEVISDLFLAFPIGVSTQLYRKTHFKHHRAPNTSVDPDHMYIDSHPNWRKRKSRWGYWSVLLRDIFFLNLKENLVESPFVKWWSPLFRLGVSKRSAQGGLSLGYKIFVLTYYFLILYCLFYFQISWKPVFLWLASLLTTMTASVRLRALPEHQSVFPEEEFTQTRSIAPLSFVERFLIAPHHINIHREHHLNPRIPHYRLPLFRQTLREHLNSDFEFNSYFGKKGAVQHLVDSAR